MDEKKLGELRAQKEKEMQTQMQIESLLRKTLTDEARQRLNNVKLVKNEVYLKALQTLFMLIQQGQVQEKISDQELKSILENISGSKKEINIRRK
ncbi:MAG: DNA-binding protein [archaeon]